MSETKTYRSWPLLIQVAIGGYLTEQFNRDDRRDRSGKALAEQIRHALGLDPKLSRYAVVPGVEDGQTWEYAEFLAIFENVTQQQLEDYAEKLEAALNDKNAEHLWADSERAAQLPKIVVSVPTSDWIKEAREEAARRSAAGKRYFRADGSINKEAVEGSGLASPESTAKHRRPEGQGDSGSRISDPELAEKWQGMSREERQSARIF